MAASLAGALVIAVILLVAFNTLSMRVAGPSPETVNVETPVSQAHSRGRDGS